MTPSLANGSSGTSPAGVRTLTRVAVAAAGILAAFLVMNVLVAALLLWSPGHRDDPALGDIPNAGLQVFGTEGYSVSRINSLGMRGSEVQPGSAGPRVLFVGDSYTEALQVSDSKTFVARAGQLLSERGNAAVQCVNAGHSGANVADYLALASAYAAAVRPAYVVVQLDEGSFVTATQRPARGWWLKREADGWRIQREYVALGGVETARALLAKLPLPYLLWERMKAGVAQETFGSDRQTQAAPSAAAGAGRADPTLSVATNPELIDWAIAQLAKSYGPNLTVLYIPTSIHYDLDSTSSPSQSEIEVARACLQHSVDIVNPRSQMEAEFRRTGQPLSGFANTQPGTGHLNAEGDRIVAEVLAERLGSRLVAAKVTR